MVKRRLGSLEAMAKHRADVALAERFDELFAQAQAVEQALRGAPATSAAEEEVYRAAKRLDSALTDVMRAAFAAQRAAIGPRGYDDRIYRRKALATPNVRVWTIEAEWLLTLRESHRLTGIPRLPRRRAGLPEERATPPRKTTAETIEETGTALVAEVRIRGETMVTVESEGEMQGTRLDRLADFNQRNNYVIFSLVTLILVIIQWVKFLLAVKPALQDTLNVGLITFSVATPIGVLIFLLIKRANGWSVAIMFVNALLAIIGAFAWIYWDSGSIHNFSIKLSHLDAVYFTLGTLTTGSGNIAAISEYSRTVQTIQLVCDLALMGFAAGVVFGRFADYIKR